MFFSGKVVGVKKGGEMVTAAERRGPWIKFKAVKDSVRVLTTKQEQSKQSVLEEGKGNSFFWIQVEEVDEEYVRVRVVVRLRIRRQVEGVSYRIDL